MREISLFMLTGFTSLYGGVYVVVYARPIVLWL